MLVEVGAENESFGRLHAVANFDICTLDIMSYNIYEVKFVENRHVYTRLFSWIN